jgi:hypothetical protein
MAGFTISPRSLHARRREHCKSASAPGQVVRVGAREWGVPEVVCREEAT